MGDVLAALVLVALVVLAGWSAETGLLGALALAFVSLLWLLVNGGMEGAVLISFDRAHGLTAADLAGFAGLGLAGFRGLRAARVELAGWFDVPSSESRPTREPRA